MAGSIGVISHHLARMVYPVGVGSIRARYVERGVAAIIEEESIEMAYVTSKEDTHHLT
jgi:hypothetical protein